MRLRGFASIVALSIASLVAQSDAQAQDRVVCRSEDYQRTFCPAPTESGVRLVRRLSDAPCTRGRSWWRDARGIVVTAGCAAEFEIGYRDSPYASAPSHGGGGFVRPERLVCKSRDYRRRYCPADIGYGVAVLVRQRSDAACIHGSTWAYDGRGVWVSNGCEGEFEIGYQDTRFEPSGGRGWVRCESRDYRANTCATSGRTARLARQISHAACIEGETWGQSRRGIWVDRGCAADFEVH